MINKWKKEQEKSIFKNPIINVIEKDYYYEEVNSYMPFTIVKMNNWALVVPVTENNEFIIVKQFRAGTESDTLEFAGGSIDKDESPIQAAKRELLEETGATAEEFIPLGILDPNPAFMCNKCNVFLAKNAKITDKQKLDKFEDTEPILIKHDELIKLVKNGEFSQSLSVAALGLYLMKYGIK